jgi:hypothetical protein
MAVMAGPSTLDIVSLMSWAVLCITLGAKQSSKLSKPRSMYLIYGARHAGTTAGTCYTCTHKAGVSGHMSQHIAKAPALGEVRLRHIKALVNGTPRGQG